MVEHECVCCVSHTNRIEEVFGKGVTRCISQWCVHCLAAHNRVSNPRVLSQRVGTRGWPLTLYPRTTLSMCGPHHLHFQAFPLMPSRSIGRRRCGSPRGEPPAFDDKRNAAVGFHLLFHLVRGQLDRKCVSGLYQRRKCDHHVQHERYGLVALDTSVSHIGLFRFLHFGHWSDIQGGIVISNKDRCRCDKVWCV